MRPEGANQVHHSPVRLVVTLRNTCSAEMCETWPQEEGCCIASVQMYQVQGDVCEAALPKQQHLSTQQGNEQYRGT